MTSQFISRSSLGYKLSDMADRKNTVRVPSSPVAVRAVGAAKLSAVDLATAEIRRSIVSGALPPGQPFNVTDLATQLGISHIPVREALRRLETEGLIELKPARSAMVTPIDVTDLRSIYDLRIQLEPPLAVKSLTVRNHQGMLQLRSLWMEAFDANVDPDTQWDDHRRFHRALVEPAASAWELRFLEQLWAASARYTRLIFDPIAAARPELEHRSDIHRELLEAVESADGGRVGACLRDHLKDNLVTLETMLADLQQTSPVESLSLEG